MPKITTKLGVAVFIVTWIVFAYLIAGRADCLRFATCDQNDLFLTAIVGAGMLIPAYILGALVSAISDREN